MNHGSRNLLFLTLAIIIFAISSTTISLAMYHNSGDIYLDRSRPGFLPDKDEAGGISDDDYAFPSSGSIKLDDLEEFLKHYEAELDYLKSLGAPFSSDLLSDENLGIPAE